MITSKQNALIKKIRSLKDKKFRDEYGEYIVEGVKMCREAIEDNIPVTALICTQSKAQTVSQFYLNYEVVSDEVMEYASAEVAPQGVIAVVSKPNERAENPRGNAVFLDGVSDPSNVGAIIRTAAATGFTDVYLAECADAFNPKAVRSSMSGIFKVKLYVGKREELLEKIDIPVVVADMGGQDIKEFKVKDPVCLIVGNESRGVSEQFRSKANHIVSLKMDNGMESLNASVAASIFMYKLSGKA